MKTKYQDQFYPETNQKLSLNHWLRICRYWYNRQLGSRFDWWEMEHYCECLSIDSQYLCTQGKAQLLLAKTIIAYH
ncbi:helix-turn-helix domain-containing protein [Microcoleus sp. C2C3]